MKIKDLIKNKYNIDLKNFITIIALANDCIT